MKTIGTFLEQILSELSLLCAAGAYLHDIWKWLCMISPSSYLSLCATAEAVLHWGTHSIQGFELLCVGASPLRCLCHCNTRFTELLLFVGMSRKRVTGESDLGSVREMLCSCAYGAWGALEEGRVSRVKIWLICFNGNGTICISSWVLGNSEQASCFLSI